jgi:hypothetical protein
MIFSVQEEIVKPKKKKDGMADILIPRARSTLLKLNCVRNLKTVNYDKSASLSKSNSNIQGEPKDKQ